MIAALREFFINWAPTMNLVILLLIMGMLIERWGGRR